MRPLVTLVAGGDPAAREAALARKVNAAHHASQTAIILEGKPDNAANFDPGIQIIRLAPGCPCCTGNLVMRVTLNRLLRQPPAQLYISIADAGHLAATRSFLTQSPYDSLITLGDDLLS